MNDNIVKVFLECVDREDCVLEILGNCWEFHPSWFTQKHYSDRSIFALNAILFIHKPTCHWA